MPAWFKDRLAISGLTLELSLLAIGCHLVQSTTQLPEKAVEMVARAGRPNQPMVKVGTEWKPDGSTRGYETDWEKIAGFRPSRRDRALLSPRTI